MFAAIRAAFIRGFLCIFFSSQWILCLGSSGSCFPKTQDLNILDILEQMSTFSDCTEVSHFSAQLQQQLFMLCLLLLSFRTVHKLSTLRFAPWPCQVRCKDNSQCLLVSKASWLNLPLLKQRSLKKEFALTSLYSPAENLT